MSLRFRPYLALIPALILALGLASCRARWRPVGPELEESLSSGGGEAVLEVGPAGEAAQARRDLPFPIATVWNATVEAVHTTGVPVPRSASCSEVEGGIDVDALWVRLLARGPGSTRVLVRYRSPPGAAGEERSIELLDELERRARLHSSAADAR